MNFVLFLLSFLCLVSPLVFAYSGRIIGGSEASSEQFPAVVSLQYASSRQHFCGGAIISSRAILTAGHCFYNRQDPADTVVYVGSVDLTSGGTYYNLASVTVHEDYNPNNLHNDVTLLKTDEDIQFSSTASVINLASTDGDVTANSQITAVGWGSVSYPNISNPDILHYVELGVLSNEDCSQRLDLTIIDSQLCVGGVRGKGLCFEDSGSPLIKANTTYGIVSFDYGDPCGQGNPTVYTRVASFANWISNHVKMNELS